MRIMLIGSPGSGKSTLARQIQLATGWPLLYLDYYWHQTDYSPAAKKRFIQFQKDFMAAHPQNWIIDGNYSGTMAVRLSQADAIIWLQVPRGIAIKRVVTRSLKRRYFGQERPDMAPEFQERFDQDYWEFLKFVWGFPGRNRQALPALIHENAPKTPLFIVSQRDRAKLVTKIAAGKLLDFSDTLNE
ncbi:topology modulation protein [Lapidilactobacillus luobeiensis]|uniref:topology modulation protein n=1 Tax=Lapidilactobacillus luobeiensis TaxID=2950371 RepID=UPI0021C428ED|nr:topology modulation protein [Lapidilactobacillus luobeiensis]